MDTHYNGQRHRRRILIVTVEGELAFTQWRSQNLDVYRGKAVDRCGVGVFPPHRKKGLERELCSLSRTLSDF